MAEMSEQPTDFARILNELQEMRSDMKKFSDKMYHLQTSSFLKEFRKNCSEVMMKGYQDAGCANWERCHPVFRALLGDILTSLNTGELSPEDIHSVREKAEKLRSRSSHDTCESCHHEVNQQLDKQIEMLRAIGVYKEGEDTPELVLSMPDEESAALFNDGLSSPIRIQILKLLYFGGKSFTDLSSTTGLRGGNLLFHLEKLQKCGMIHKDGEYLMSYRGYEILHAVVPLFQKSKQEDE